MQNGIERESTGMTTIISTYVYRSRAMPNATNTFHWNHQALYYLMGVNGSRGTNDNHVTFLWPQSGIN